MAGSEANNDLVLTVFQASPLAYEDVKGTANALHVLDFEKESTILRETLEQKGVRLRIETASCRSLGDFLSQGNRLLHFSGHGEEDFIYIENDFGGGHRLLVDEDLKAWIRAGGNNLKFVFVAACHSRKAGELFVDAGVPHVVCAEQNQHKLSHEAASVFARDLYGALANGRTVQEAFVHACNGVRQAPEIARTRLDPKVEASKFVLLPEGDCHGMCLFSGAKALQSAMSPTHRPLRRSPTSLLPFPPSDFVGRELEMYSVLRSMIVDEERLVRVTGEKGIGKQSFGKAIAHYMDRRKIWGDVMWVPSAQGEYNYNPDILLSHIMKIVEKHDNSDSLESDKDYQRVRQQVVQTLFERKAVAIIDATKFNQCSINLLSTFVHDLLERTRQVKLLVLLQEGTKLAPTKLTGFPHCRDTHIHLARLDFNRTFFLFVRNCRHAYANNWSVEAAEARYRAYPEIVLRLLGEGIPTKTVIVAKHISEAEYTKLVTKYERIAETDFTQVLGHLAKYESEQGSQTPTRSQPQDTAKKNSSVFPPAEREHPLSRRLPPVKSQKEVQTRFVELLREDGKIFRKKASAYIRPARKWETIDTVINGKHETQKTVDDDTSMVVCGKSNREFYVLTADEFRDSYDEKSLKQIPARTKDDHLRYLRKEGFCEYKSTRFVWGRAVSEEDMNFFRHGAESPDFAVFVAPWGSTERVEKGDYLVMQYPAHGKRNDGVYRIEKGVFKKTYVDTDREADDEEDAKYWPWIAAVGIAGLAVAGILALSRTKSRR